MKTATHDGTCQVCGRQQRLPDGRMAKHGYQILGRSKGGFGGYFSGVCWGSAELPFQKSCDLVKASITRALDERNRILAMQVELRQPATEPTGPVHVYFTNRYFGGHYRWVDAKVEKTADGNFDIVYEGETSSGEPRTARRRAYEIVSYMVDRDALAIASAMRLNHAKALTRDVDELDEYIKMQQLRVDTWKPMPLLKRAG